MPLALRSNMIRRTESGDTDRARSFSPRSPPILAKNLTRIHQGHCPTLMSNRKNHRTGSTSSGVHIRRYRDFRGQAWCDLDQRGDAMLTWRTAALTAVTAALVAGCSSASAPPADTSGAASTTAAGTATKAAPKSARGDGDESAIDTIPWDDVGPGWTLATWTMDPVHPRQPTGHRRIVRYDRHHAVPGGPVRRSLPDHHLPVAR